MNKYWKNTYEYRRILEILDDYWLTEPEEKEVSVQMHFVKANGETQDKLITWQNPSMDHDDEVVIENLRDVFDEFLSQAEQGKKV